jgi:hypothetical protein
MQVPNLKKVYDLRWRFEYSDEKPAKYGAWSRSGNTSELHAWCQNKTNLLFAIVEGKHIETKQTMVLAECSGQDFCNFEWKAVAIMPGIKGTTPLHSTLVGLTIVSRDFITTVMIDGRIGTMPRALEDKNFHYAGYGR